MSSGDANPNAVNYVTPPTVGRFMLDEHFVRLIMGPVGSGKSAGCFMELLRRAKLQTPNAQGIRQTRFAIVRNTLQQLRQTCLADIQQWLNPIIQYKTTDATIRVRLPLEDGTRVESDWMLIPLDSKEDQQRLLSLNLTGAWVSEFREVKLSLIDAIAGRLGRYPAKAVAPVTWWGIVAESNPPDEDSEWYEKMELNLPPNWALYKQPGGLDPDAENIENLPPNYYENLAANNNDDWVDIHVHAKYGRSLGGQAVFRASFKPDFHLDKSWNWKPVDGLPIMVAQDFGRTPAALIGQMDNRGRLIVFDEVCAVDCGIEQFARDYLRPKLYEKYSGRNIFVVGDPSGRYKGQVGEESPFECLERLGFLTMPAPSNDLDPRLRGVESFLLQQRDGGPALVICEDTCPTLALAMKSKYRFKRKQNDELDDKPEKSHPWSDVADCLQYMCLSANTNMQGRVMRKINPPERRQPPPVASWT